MALLKIMFFGIGITISATHPISAMECLKNIFCTQNDWVDNIPKNFKMTFYNYDYDSYFKFREQEIFKRKKEKIKNANDYIQASDAPEYERKLLEEKNNRAYEKQLDQIESEENDCEKSFLAKAKVSKYVTNTLWPKYPKKANKFIGLSTANALSEFCDPSSSDGLLIIQAQHESFGKFSKTKYSCPTSLTNMIRLGEKFKNYSRETQTIDGVETNFWLGHRGLRATGIYDVANACYSISACCSSCIEITLKGPLFGNLLNIKVGNPSNKSHWKNVYDDVREFFNGYVGINPGVIKFLEINNKYGTDVDSTHKLILRIYNSNNEIENIAWAPLNLQESNNPVLDPTFLENSKNDLRYFLYIEKIEK